MGGYAGVEWAADKHDVVVADEAGTEVLSATFAYDERGLRLLCSQLVGLKVGLVAIERPDGLLVERLLDAGLRVLALHPDQVAATRAGFRGSGSSDTSQSRRRSYVTRVRDRLSHFSFGRPVVLLPWRLCRSQG